MMRFLRAVASGLRHAPRMAMRVPQAWRVWRVAGWRGVAWELRRRLRPAHDYAAWLRAHEPSAEVERTIAEQWLAQARDLPLLAIVMPCYNPDPDWLRAAIGSVRAQWYPHWQLCIADDASTRPGVHDVLRASAAEDARIRVVLREQNGHIAEASNSALALVDAPWIALMDHDDLLPPCALWRVAECLVANPDARLVYSDEDKIDAHGVRSDPYFKPDWNLDLFRSQNVFSHLGVLHTALVRSVGGFRRGFEGSQDWDLVLRCVEQVRSDQVLHIPLVLYHWRIHAQSTAQGMSAKPYAAVAGERALDEHYRRLGIDARAEYLGYGYRTHFALSQPLPLVSIIVPTRNAEQWVRRCIDSIASKTSYGSWELVLMDNGSDDAQALQYFDELARRPQIRVLQDARPFNFAALNNRGVAEARGEFVVLVNNDVEVLTPGWLEEMVGLARQPGVGAVGARLWYPDRTLQHGGVVLGIGGVAGHAHKGLPRGLHGYAGRAALVQSFSAVTAACLLVRKSIYQGVGGMDEVNLPVAFNDVDFCLRLQESGYRTVWTPFAELVHHESATRGEDIATPENQRFAGEMAYMHQRWAALIAQDPAYSPNLSLASEEFAFAWPPRGRSA